MSNRNTTNADQIDRLLPQTQCGLCEYEGCRPYAQAIAEKGEAIDHCLPGGVATLQKLGALTGINPEPYVADMKQKAKPALIAVIDEDVCIGCTKCIQACPVDAILGSGKLMHTVIANECSGCELCIEPCPVDCIDMVAIDQPNEEQMQQRADQFRQRFDSRNSRLERDQLEKKAKHLTAKSLNNSDRDAVVAARKAEILAAVARKKTT